MLESLKTQLYPGHSDLVFFNLFASAEPGYKGCSVPVNAAHGFPGIMLHCCVIILIVSQLIHKGKCINKRY